MMDVFFRIFPVLPSLSSLRHSPPTDAFMDSTSLRRPAGQESSIKATKGPLMMPSHTPCLGVSVQVLLGGPGPPSRHTI